MIIIIMIIIVSIITRASRLVDVYVYTTLAARCLPSHRRAAPAAQGAAGRLGPNMATA